jgi:hypothetical protein
LETDTPNTDPRDTEPPLASRISFFPAEQRAAQCSRRGATEGLKRQVNDVILRALRLGSIEANADHWRRTIGKRRATSVTNKQVMEFEAIRLKCILICVKKPPKARIVP